MQIGGFFELTPTENRNRHPGGRPRKEIDREELKRLLKAGHSLRQIGRILDRGYGSVSRAVKALSPAETDPRPSGATQNPTA
jgi:DNA-binding CsgD family transcriptional regulator